LKKQRSDIVQCPACPNQNAEGELFCSVCGTELAESVQEQPPETHTVADGLLEAPTETPPESPPLNPEALEEFRLLTVPKVPISVVSFGTTHVGLVKENNEDALIVERVEYPLHKIAVHVVVLADGMGGEPAGEVFGQMAVHETWTGIRFLLPFHEQQLGFSKLEFWRFTNSQIAKNLQAQVASANKRIRNYAAFKKFEVGECGSTIVVAVAVCDLETGYVKLHGYNIGDARLAVVMGDQFTQLSTDHTIAGAPYRFLGKYDHISGSQFSWEFWAAEASVSAVWILLYSDGFWNMISPQRMTQKCSVSNSPKRLCLGMVKEALCVAVPHGRELGDERVTTGDDNITFGAIQIQF
jgi:serine/threonine protein phosphatase PrpC